MKKLLSVIFVVAISVALIAQKKVEMRAAWIATVANIDWPSAYNYNSNKQMAEMIAILDSLASLNINVVYFQIRPSSDTFYYSDFEPWSRYLTGMQNREPKPYYDPLAFVINEAHKRFIDVHVWINPYRVLNSDRLSDLHPNHLYYRRPDMFVKYAGKYYFNPGLDETRSYLCDVVRDVVRRYDIDGVHFDDYFYPYKVKDEMFPDHSVFMENPRGFDCIEDWRRNNVDMVIEELGQTIKEEKSWVEFGISPFGVWRNKVDDASGSNTNAGVRNYDDLYANVLLWLEEGWIDYVVPQLYWEIGKETADYAVLIDWWSKNTSGKNLYIGLTSSKLNSSESDAWQQPNELYRQIKLNDKYDEVKGEAFFSTSTFLQNRQGLCDSLTQNDYALPAIPPSVSMDAHPNSSPINLRIEQMGKRPYLYWEEIDAVKAKQVSYYLVYVFDNMSTMDLNNPKFIYKRTKDNCIDLSGLVEEKSSCIFVVTSVNRYHKESVVKTFLQYEYK